MAQFMRMLNNLFTVPDLLNEFKTYLATDIDVNTATALRLNGVRPSSSDVKI